MMLASPMERPEVKQIILGLAKVCSDIIERLAILAICSESISHIFENTPRRSGDKRIEGSSENDVNFKLKREDDTERGDTHVTLPLSMSFGETVDPKDQLQIAHYAYDLAVISAPRHS